MNERIGRILASAVLLFGLALQGNDACGQTDKGPPRFGAFPPSLTPAPSSVQPPLFTGIAPSLTPPPSVRAPQTVAPANPLVPPSVQNQPLAKTFQPSLKPPDTLLPPATGPATPLTPPAWW